MDKGSGRRRRQIAYGAAALACFGLLWWGTFWKAGSAPRRQDVRIVTFGDSVLGECRDATSVTAQLQELTGVPVYNGNLGGTCFCRIDRERRLSYTKDCLNMTALAAAIQAGDFRVPRSARIRENATEYFPETLEGLSEIDFSRVETVFLEYGLNDYHAGAPIQNEEDPYDEYTFSGAIRSVVRRLREACPGLRIILVTPTYTWYRDERLTCEEYDPGGGTLDLYVEAELQTAAELGVELIDVYHDFYPHDTWEDWQRYTRDGMHPNEAGRELLARTLAAYLQEEPGSQPHLAGYLQEDPGSQPHLAAYLQEDSGSQPHLAAYLQEEPESQSRLAAEEDRTCDRLEKGGRKERIG